MRYVLLFRGLAAAPEATDDQTAEYNQRWSAWSGELAQSGVLVDGAPFEARGMVVTAGAVEELELERVDIGGFFVIEAADDEAACAVARAAPHTELGGTTIVRPVVARVRPRV